MSITTMEQHNSKDGRIIYDHPPTPPQESLHWKRLGDCHHICNGVGGFITDDVSGNDGCDDAGGDGDTEMLIHTHEELIAKFQKDVASLSKNNNKTSSNKRNAINTSNDDDRKSNQDSTVYKKRNKENYLTVAIWSCIIGYCEALSTHKDANRRYAMYPIPIHALRQLVHKEFLPLLTNNNNHDHTNSTTIANKGSTPPQQKPQTQSHRQAVQTIANTIWKRAQNKKSGSMKDELHANNLYICLCGDVDGKSLDCFGAALLVVVGMNYSSGGLGNSCLTLSEDHAYETHYWEEEDDATTTTTYDDAGERQPPKKKKKLATCEVAIPGNTKAAQSKRGREISETFAKQHPNIQNNITAETSWLYMAKNPVFCDTAGMAMAAMVGNVNCDVDKQKKQNSSSNGNGGSDVGDGGKIQVVSGPLYKLKRDMLWTLHDAKYMDKFPFALMELGECEEHLSSKRGMEWVDVSELLTNEACDDEKCMDDDDNCGKILVLWNEKLFLDAISVSRNFYGDAQAYPYLYAGHYHKDAGKDSQEQEYRLVESLRLYSEASRVASTYRYDSKDCIQLMKHMTTVASLISRDILLLPIISNSTKIDGKKVKEARRAWHKRDNAIAAATWLIGFFDSLMFWEEQEVSSFVEILGMQHKHFFGKLFQLFDMDVRMEAVSKIQSSEASSTTSLSVITDEELIYFSMPRSKRLSKDGLLVMALTKERVAIRDLELAIPSNGIGRQRKRTCVDR